MKQNNTLLSQCEEESFTKEKKRLAYMERFFNVKLVVQDPSQKLSKLLECAALSLLYQRERERERESLVENCSDLCSIVKFSIARALEREWGLKFQRELEMIARAN